LKHTALDRLQVRLNVILLFYSLIVTAAFESVAHWKVTAIYEHIYSPISTCQYIHGVPETWSRIFYHSSRVVCRGVGTKPLSARAPIG